MEVIDVIKTFANKETQQFYEGKLIKQWESFARQAEKRLQILDSATTLDDLRALPSNRLEVLRGNRKGQMSIRFNKQWRICFKWFNHAPYQVEIVDYHT